jgi:Domain of unknown function (DUF5666)
MKRWMKESLAGVAALGLMSGPVALATQDAQQQSQQQRQQRGARGAGAQQQQAQELSGTFSEVKGDQLFVETKDNVIVPLKISKQTRFEGQMQTGQPLSSAKQFNEGDQIRASFVPQQNDNIAQSITLEKQALGEVSGPVARSSANEFFVQKDGALVPVNVDQNTQFRARPGAGKQVASARDIKPGDEVRANIAVKDDTRNVAQSVEVIRSQQGMGGAGQQPGQQQPGQQQQEQQ